MESLKRPDRMGKVPKLRSTPVFTTGPRVLGLARDPQRLGGPGEPPPNFVSATTSKDEWFVYWGLSKVFDDPEDPRIPPFWGGRDWGYQIAVHGGRRIRGGSVVDFEVDLPGETIGIRVQTERFHYLSAGPAKEAYDVIQAQSLSRDMTVKDIYSQDFLFDRTGQAVVQNLIELLGGRKRISPITSQRARRVREWS